MFKINKPNIGDLTKIIFDNSKNKLSENLFLDQNIELSKSIDINSCKFNNIVFSETKINIGEVVDVIFCNCDLSNVNFYNIGFYRVEFINCKLVGTNFIDCSLNDVVIKDSKCNYMNISGCKIKNIAFIESVLINSYFTSNSTKNILMDNVDLKLSEIINTRLNGVDLSDSNIEDIKVDPISIKGVTIEYYQAIYLINLLEVKIKI